MKHISLFVLILTLVPLGAMAEKTIGSGNFAYQGCIRAPADLEIAGLTYYPSGDPGGAADGYPGSLYVMSAWEEVLEMTVPTPSIEASSGNCPTATVRRSLTNIGCNLDPLGDGARSGGIAYYNDLGGVGEKLYWTIYEYYNVGAENHDSAGWMDMDLTGCAGGWGMTGTGGEDTDGNSEPYHSMQWEDYIFEIHDKAWADTHLDGRYLLYGKHREAGCCGSATGPALYAAAPWEDGNPIPNNGNMNGQILLAYSGTWDLTVSHYFPAVFGDPEYRPTDRWSGAAWVRVGTEDAIVFTGRKSLGPEWYGDGGNGCNPYQGYHGDPYEPRWWFYDPSDLECVAAGTCDSWDPTPYAIHDPSGEIYSDDCFNDIEWQGGATFDDANDIFYFAESVWNGTGFDSVIHVYRVNGSSANNTLTVTKDGGGFGTVTSSPAGIDCGVDCQEVYGSGTNVQLAALPNNGSYFVGWSGDGDCTDGTVVLTSDRTCIATFEQGTLPTFSLSLTTTGTGTGTVTSTPAGINCGGDCLEDYNQGTVVQLAASPDAGSVFAGWSGAADCNDGTVTLDTDTSCTATFNEATGAIGLVAAYGFEEASGSTVTDSSGQANAGTLAGPTWTSQGYFGNALSFDGVNDMVTIPDADSLDLTTGMTIEAWVRPASLSGWRTAVLKESGSGLAYSLYAYDNAPQPAGYVYIGGDQSVTGGANLPLESWSHLATTYDGSTLRLYVDGEQVGSRSIGGAIGTTNSPLSIGGNTVWGEYFEGTIDEIRLYDRALSQSEIQNDMNSPVDGSQQTEFTLNITREGSGSGTVTSSPAGIDCGADCVQDYDEGTVVQLTATAGGDSSFTTWSGDPDCSDGQVTMNNARSCTASFELLPPARHTLIVSRTGNGTGTVTSSPAGIDCGADCVQDYDEGTVVELTATPQSDSQFVNWSGDADCSDGQITMTNERSCTASFELLPPHRHTLTVSKIGAGSGTISSSPNGIDCGNDCSQDYDEGTVVQLSTSPANGSIFVSWSGDVDCVDGEITLNGSRNCTAAFEPENPFESKIVPGTSSIRWKKAKLRRDYQSMVAVCNPQYSNEHPPLAVRIRNALKSSFEVKLERLDGNSGGISGIKVYCTVIEGGTYPADLYGVNIEAARFTSTQTDRADSWLAEARSYSLAFDSPVVLGQVMTANDERFSVFWSRGAAVEDPPSSTDLWIGKHVAEDPDFVRADESIGYIVIETGKGYLGGTSYEAGVGEQIVKGYGNQPPYSYGLDGGAPHPHAAVSIAGMKSTDGGWANLYGDNSVSPFMLQLAVDEDQLQDLERGHPRESVAYLVFEPADSEIFWDDLESGDITSWSSSVP